MQFGTLDKNEKTDNKFDLTNMQEKLVTSPQTNAKMNKIPNPKSFMEKDLRVLYKNFMDLTKFKLSLLNSIGAYSMFFYFAPL